MGSESLIKSKVSIHKKVSKPLMEKKRRARINRSLDQLKTLLENLYSNNIRKRKLEKADILELTVKHLKHIQKTQKGLSSATRSICEYQAGFSSCVSSVNQYLLRADVSAVCRSAVLTQLSHSLLKARSSAPCYSTRDSDSSSPAHINSHALKRSSQNRSGQAPTVLQHIYWRPW
ncbi:hairy-related 3 [Hoplias malabaricus]|uniref:hairy-related 3 n=1 Tax=Hoplias malabaricus TaxID=27720 RepID=UPI0034622EBD